MQLFTVLDIIAIILIGIHFGVPLIYYWYAKTKWLPRPWNIKTDPNYQPKITIIIPTYNEAKYIEKKLDNILEQNYPKDNIQVIVVDSASNDGTAQLVEYWVMKKKGLKVKLILEKSRRGKLNSIMNIIRNKEKLTGDILILTDADAFWEQKALNKIAIYFSEPQVGVVTGSIKYIVGDEDNVKIITENIYRKFYNIIRVAESKKHSTPIHNGPLQAFRYAIIKEIGLPSFPGADDSAFASYIAFAGYRAIQVEDIWVYEAIRGNTFKRKIRRAQHLILNFILTKKYAINKKIYKKSVFEKIWEIERFLIVINPWLLMTSLVILIFQLLFNESLNAILMLVSGTMLLFFKPFATWIIQQFYLVIATIINLWTRNEIWEK